MFELSDMDLAKLHTRFVVPMVVGQMLAGEDELDDVADYTMNGMMSEMQPDGALLTIALSAMHVANALSHIGMSRMLRAEAERIVDEYGALWLAHDADPQSVSDSEICAKLPYIPEDLEALAHLFDALLASLSDHESLQARLCDMMAMQAYEHMEQAECELMEVDLLPPGRQIVAKMQASAAHGPERTLEPISATVAIISAQTDNIIPFPRSRA